MSRPETVTRPQDTVTYTAGREAQVRRGVDAIALEALATTFPAAHDEMRALMTSIVDRRTDAGFAQVVASLLTVADFDDFIAEVDAAGLPLSDVPEILRGDEFTPVLSLMSQDSWHYRLQLGIIFSQISYNDLPTVVQENLRLLPVQQRLGQETTSKGWMLCHSAEERMSESIEDKAVIALEDNGIPYFLLKFKGKATAVCIQDCITPDGTIFLRGNWYSPDWETREPFRVAFDADQGIAPLQEGRWIFMRPVQKTVKGTAEEIVDELTVTAWNRPEIYEANTIAGGDYYTARREYRRDNVEYFRQK